MHKYLKAAGFSEYTAEGAIYRLIRNRVAVPENLSARLGLGDGTMLIEYRMPVNDLIGICAGELVSAGEFSQIQYYYPYYDSYIPSSDEACTLERHTGCETYAGVIDELDIGLSLIFFVNNPLEFRQRLDAGMDNEFHGTALSAFANAGMVLLPVVEGDLSGGSSYSEPDPELLAAARGGDAEAIEVLTASDMDMYQQISERIETEDLYSLVEQSFMPCGIECDQYSIIGKINSVMASENTITGEKLWLLRVSCNDVEFSLCIRQDDLLGEPLAGRRIKCRLWMQGMVNSGQ